MNMSPAALGGGHLKSGCNQGNISRLPVISVKNTVNTVLMCVMCPFLATIKFDKAFRNKKTPTVLTLQVGYVLYHAPTQHL